MCQVQNTRSLYEIVGRKRVLPLLYCTKTTLRSSGNLREFDLTISACRRKDGGMPRHERHVIQSLQNPKIKFLAQLDKPRARRAEGLFLIEGFREITLAHEAGYGFEQVFWCPSIGSPYPIQEFVDALPSDVLCYEVSRDVFAKIAYRDNVDGLLVVARTLPLMLDHLALPPNPLLIVLETVEKPGNLGAILRTADAARVDAVIVCDSQTDIYNPNVVRSSLGCLFTGQIAIDSTVNVLAFLHQRGIHIYAAAVIGAQSYHLTDFIAPCAIVMGAEAQGLSDTWLMNATARIQIPMLGKVDSLNVSVSTAILVYEARRQRGF